MQTPLGEEEMRQMQVRDSMRFYNELVSLCFDTCVYNFKTRKIDNNEEECLHRCTDKYLRHMSRVGRIFAEQSLLNAEKANEKK